jgi:hypothetical protein
MSQCLECGTALAPNQMNCAACGRHLAALVKVAEASLDEEVFLFGELLKSAGFQPTIAWLDETGRPHPILDGRLVTPAGGLLPPVTTPFAVFVAQEEADEAIQVLRDAGRQRLSDETSPF